MRKEILLLVVSIGLLASCTPKVVTEVREEYPAVAVGSVMMYGEDESAPERAREVGTVSVTANGYTASCSYPTILRRAVETTAKHGGNVLKVRKHEWPDEGQSCHQLWGDMLRVDTLSPDTLARRAVYARGDSRNKSQSVIKINAGMTWITSDIYTSYNHSSSGYHGYELDFAWERYGSELWGYGLYVSLNHTDIEASYEMNQFFVGPGLILSGMVTRHLRLSYSSSVGLGILNDNDYGNEYGLGFQERLGCEYMLSRRFGLCAELLGQVNLFGPDDKYRGRASNEQRGVNRLGLTLGLVYHL